jgi:hypothetical protein
MYYTSIFKKDARRRKRREIDHGGKITNQVTDRVILPRMLVSNDDRSMLEEKNERIEQEQTENGTSDASPFIHGGFTTSDYDGRPSSRSFLHFKRYGNATATPKTPSTSCDSAVLVDNMRLPGIIPYHRLTPIPSTIVSAIIGLP